MPAPAVPGGEVDERFIKEWLAYGFRAMSVYLAHWAEFDAWLEAHPQPKDSP